jgi:Na+-transporting NADH:ubiquinone oxidoreductase subunit C
MDVNSNKYTYFFATVMVVVVAVLLSGLFLSLKPYQDANVEQEKRQDILKSIGVNVTRSEAIDVYDQYIKRSVVIKNGAIVSEDPSIAFNIDMAKAVKADVTEREVPLYVAEKDGSTYYIVPMRGTGLWGPIWGNLALKDDGNTVLGATFGHKGETPGLGAEIATDIFQDQFPDKQIMEGNSFTSISVIKSGSGYQPSHEVDGISGGTITSNAVDVMLEDCLQPYVGYFQNLNNN